MALINCRECARQVSDRAQSCPHCGYPMGTAAVPAPPTETPAPRAVEPAATQVAQPSLRESEARWSATTRRPPFALQWRSAIPARKPEQSGLYFFVVLAVLSAVLTFYYLADTRTIAILVASACLAAALLPLVRTRLAFGLFFSLLALSMLYTVWDMLTADDARAMGREVWTLTAVELWLVYFWRRRWWYGLPLTAEVPSEVSDAGMWRVGLEALALAFIVAVIGVILAVMRAG